MTDRCPLTGGVVRPVPTYRTAAYAHGSMIGASPAAKCLLLRVITSKPCRRAVAASNPSLAGIGMPARSARAVRRPHRRATSASTGRIWSANRCSNPSSQAASSR